MATQSKNYHIEIQGLDDLIKDFKKAGADFAPHLKQAMVLSTNRLKDEIRENITSKGISNTGNLRESVGTHSVTAYKGVVGVGERYGGAVEYGRRRGKMPPVAAIERWAQTKLGVSGAGFVIARKIGKVGTKAQPYVEPAYRSASYIAGYFKEAVDKTVRTMATGR